MLNTRIALSAVTAAAVLVIASTVAVSAADNEQVVAEQSQEASAKCSASGQYGADVDCKLKLKQNQKIVVYTPRTKVLGKTHTPVNTALDTSAMTAVFASGILGVAAFAGYLKLSK